MRWMSQLHNCNLRSQTKMEHFLRESNLRKCSKIICDLIKSRMIN
ncbi:hypothetical protein Goklo_004322 [Gossypium klotzschianum]|uniref:Uncharacterized protein n=1 Tax=Gossypium klotzschianum TaxID=34286 RepID=A0A7J8VN93_9ROSI|nr:hypothetical protein [Gossypium klotzschianum]